jgi:hypothetical protein
MSWWQGNHLILHYSILCNMLVRKPTIAITLSFCKLLLNLICWVYKIINCVKSITHYAEWLIITCSCFGLRWLYSGSRTHNCYSYVSYDSTNKVLDRLYRLARRRSRKFVDVAFSVLILCPPEIKWDREQEGLQRRRETRNCYVLRNHCR